LRSNCEVIAGRTPVWDAASRPRLLCERHSASCTRVAQAALKQAQKAFETALDEACGVDLKQVDTGELIRIEETLALASRPQTRNAGAGSFADSRAFQLSSPRRLDYGLRRTSGVITNRKFVLPLGGSPPVWTVTRSAAMPRATM
jgi:hypothetical protein